MHNLNSTSVTWYGKSGQPYTLEIYPINQEFNPVSGVYIICREVSPNRWQALYVGETQSFHDRLNTGRVYHDGFKRAANRGATHIAVMLVSSEADRLRIETDLRHGLNPVCNRQGISSAFMLGNRN